MIRISEKNTTPRRCECGCGGFFVEKETEEYIVWKCDNCGRTQKFIKGREIELPGFLEDPSWFNN